MADVGKISAMRIAMSYGPELSFLVLLRILIGMHRSDIIDHESRVRPTLAPQTSYDFVIIGGGSAGSVLANRLSENSNWTVLLLEAGADEPDFSDVPSIFPVLQLTPVDWQFKTEPSDNYCKAMRGHECNWPRGKVVRFLRDFNWLIFIRRIFPIVEILYEDKIFCLLRLLFELNYCYCYSREYLSWIREEFSQLFRII